MKEEEKVKELNGFSAASPENTASGSGNRNVSPALPDTKRQRSVGKSSFPEIITPHDLLSEGWIAETRGWEAANKRILTARRMIALADFSAGDPSRWRTIRARFFFEELSVNDLAEMLGISRRTVTRHLQPLHLSEDIYDGLARIPGNTPPKGTFPQGSSCE